MCFLSSLWFIGSMWWRYTCLLFCPGQELTFCSLWVFSLHNFAFRYWILNMSSWEVIYHLFFFFFFHIRGRFFFISFHRGKKKVNIVKRKRKMPSWKKVHWADYQRRFLKFISETQTFENKACHAGCIPQKIHFPQFPFSILTRLPNKTKFIQIHHKFTSVMLVHVTEKYTRDIQYYQVYAHYKLLLVPTANNWSGSWQQLNK